MAKNFKDFLNNDYKNSKEIELEAIEEIATKNGIDPEKLKKKISSLKEPVPEPVFERIEVKETVEQISEEDDGEEPAREQEVIEPKEEPAASQEEQIIPPTTFDVSQVVKSAIKEGIRELADINLKEELQSTYINIQKREINEGKETFFKLLNMAKEEAIKMASSPTLDIRLNGDSVEYTNNGNDWQQLATLVEFLPRLEMRKQGHWIQYKFRGQDEAEWKNVFSVTEIPITGIGGNVGGTGPKGDSGREIALQVDADLNLQYRYTGVNGAGPFTEWKTLASLFNDGIWFDNGVDVVTDRARNVNLQANGLKDEFTTIPVRLADAGNAALTTGSSIVGAINAKQDRPASAIENNFATFNTTKDTKDSGISLVTTLDETGTDLHIPSEQAVREMFNPIRDRLHRSLGCGVLSGLTISINGTDNTKIDISAGVAGFTNTDDIEHPTAQKITFSAQTGIAVNYIASANATYIALDSSGNIIQQTTPFTPTQRRNHVILGAAIHSNRTTINVVNNFPDVVLNVASQLDDLADSLKSFNISGNIISANGANLNINKNAGQVFKKGANFQNDSKNPHVITTPTLTAPTTLRYRLRDGTEYSNTAVIDPDYYDLNGVRTIVPTASPFSIQRFVLFPSSNLIRIQYGQATYKTMAEAIASINTEAFIVEQNMADNGLLRAILVVNKGTTALNVSTNAVFYEVDRFGGTSSGAGGAATTNLQQAYNNSLQPQVTTSTTLGAVQVKRGSASDTDTTFEVLNGAGNSVNRFRGDGQQRMSLTGRPWRDELGDSLSLRSTGPGVVANVTESVMEFAANAALSDYLYKNLQLNHDRDETSIVGPHIHWFQASSAVPNFLLQYRWQINGGAKVTSWTNLRCNIAVTTYTSGTIHQICETPTDITPPAGSVISDIIQFRIIRDTANSSGVFGGADTYSGVVGVLSFDLHVQINSLGSTSEFTK